MVSRIRIQLWDEAIEVSHAFSRLRDAGLDEAPLQMLTEQLIIERSLRDYRITEDSFNPDALLADYRANLSPPQQAKLDGELKSAPDTRQRLLNRLLLEARLKTLKTKVIPSPLVQDAFINYKSQRENVMFQVLRLPDEKLARELYFRFQHDHYDFDRMVREHAEAKEAEEGGLVGPVPIGKVKAELKQQLALLKPGECSAPFSVGPRRWMLVRLLRRDNLLMTPELETQLREGLFSSWLQQQSNSARNMPAALGLSQGTPISLEASLR